ncbi:MAG: hypothetical protein ACLGJD_12275 [Gammaproteobacteria bacterium]
MSQKVNSNAYLVFSEMLRELLQAIQAGHSVVEFTHTWGGDSGYGSRDTPRLDIEFEARITRINGEPISRVKRSNTNPTKKGKR